MDDNNIDHNNMDHISPEFRPNGFSQTWNFQSFENFLKIFEVLKYLDVLTSWELLERVFYE